MKLLTFLIHFFTNVGADIANSINNSNFKRKK